VDPAFGELAVGSLGPLQLIVFQILSQPYQSQKMGATQFLSTSLPVSAQNRKVFAKPEILFIITLNAISHL